jgi:hypothetical protein
MSSMVEHIMSTVASATASSKYPAARNFIGGRFTAHATRYQDVLNPSDGTLLARVPVSTAEEVSLK